MPGEVIDGEKLRLRAKEMLGSLTGTTRPWRPSGDLVLIEREQFMSPGEDHSLSEPRIKLSVRHR